MRCALFSFHFQFMWRLLQFSFKWQSFFFYIWLIHKSVFWFMALHFIWIEQKTDREWFCIILEKRYFCIESVWPTNASEVIQPLPKSFGIGNLSLLRIWSIQMEIEQFARGLAQNDAAFLRHYHYSIFTENILTLTWSSFQKKRKEQFVW